MVRLCVVRGRLECRGAKEMFKALNFHFETRSDSNLPMSHQQQSQLLGRLRELERSVRDAIDGLGRAGEPNVHGETAKRLVAEFSSTLAEASQFLAPYDVQVRQCVCVRACVCACVRVCV